MPFQGGKFKQAGAPSGKPVRTAPKDPAQDKEADNPPQRSVKSNAPEAPHGDSQEKHVTATHPGKTQPHPETGVHSVSINHVGEGQYQTHTHHDDGRVETREHPSYEDMKAAADESLPPDNANNGGQESDIRNGGLDFGNEISGIGGNAGGNSQDTY